MKYKFYVVVIPEYEAETTTSCPTRAVAREVVNKFKKWQADGAAGERPKTYKPGDKVPDEVAVHVVDEEREKRFKKKFSDRQIFGEKKRPK